MNSEELRVVIQELHPACFGWALHCCRGDRDQAMDILQSVYVDVLSGKARFSGRSSAKTWLFSVIRNSAHSLRRKLSRQLNLLHQTFRPEHHKVSHPERLVMDRERFEKIRHLLGGLPKRQREILVLVFYHDLTVQAAAEVMGVSLGTARRHFHRAKLKLRASIAKAGVYREHRLERTRDQRAF